MDRDELSLKLKRLPQQIHDAHETIANYARGLIPVLRDAGRENSAKELDRLFFELDVLHQEMKDLAQTHTGQILQILVERLKSSKT